MFCNDYFNTKRFDKVIAKIRRCSFFTHSVHNITQEIEQINIQSGPEKNVQSLMHHHFATVMYRITRFSLKCSEINS